MFRFHARDLHLVLGPAPEGGPVRFRVTIDGAAPGDSHGVDTDADGNGVVTGQRLYQLVRQKARSPTTRSRSGSSIPASRPTRSRSADIRPVRREGHCDAIDAAAPFASAMPVCAAALTDL